MPRELTAIVRELVASRSAFPGHLTLEDDTDLLSAGILDSVGMLSLLDDLETRLSCVIPPEALTAATFQSVQSLVAAVTKYSRRPS